MTQEVHDDPVVRLLGLPVRPDDIAERCRLDAVAPLNKALVLPVPQGDPPHLLHTEVPCRNILAGLKFAPAYGGGVSLMLEMAGGFPD